MQQHSKLLPSLHCRRPWRVPSQWVLGLQVLRLGECTSLHGKPAAAAVLAIAQHGKLRKLTLPCLRETGGVVLDLLRDLKDLECLSVSQLRYASPLHKGSSCK